MPAESETWESPLPTVGHFVEHLKTSHSCMQMNNSTFIFRLFARKTYVSRSWLIMKVLIHTMCIFPIGLLTITYIFLVTNTCISIRFSMRLTTSTNLVRCAEVLTCLQWSKLGIDYI